MTVSPNIFDGSQYLAFKVVSISYGSDPDIFISSTNQFPNSAIVSDYYCMKEGSDTCVVNPSNIQTNQVFYIGVYCVESCQYNLRTHYMSIINLTDGVQSTQVLDDFTSALYSYYIPGSASDGFTNAVNILAQGDDSYKNIEIYTSFDSTLYQIQEKKNSIVTSKGVGMQITSNDLFWCISCKIYILIDLDKGGNLYLTAKATARNNKINLDQSFELMINSQQSSCVQYYVQNVNSDIVFTSTQMEGNTDFYIASSYYPLSPTDSKVSLLAGRYVQRSILASFIDRTQWKNQGGLYYMCFNANEDSSAKMSVNEVGINSTYEISNNNQFTYRTQNSSYTQFLFSSASLSTPCLIQVTLQFVSPSNAQNTIPRIFYQVCNSSSKATCLTAKISNTTNETGKNITNGSRIGYISHNPSVCVDPKNCYYVFSTINYFNGTVQNMFTVNTTLSPVQTVLLNIDYVNINTQGSYQYYQLLPSLNPTMIYMNALIIDLYTYQGDANLYVSTINQYPNSTNYQYRSRRVNIFDQVVVNGSLINPTLQIPIYISVFSAKQASFIIKFEPQYIIQENANLIGATALYEAQGSYQYLKNQYASSFFSFTPWWTDGDQRNIIFVASVIFNNISIYADVNNFPLPYQNSWKQQNNTVFIPITDSQYSVYKTYFVRVLPNFGLYDLVANRQFIFNFYAFSQQQNTTQIDLQVNELTMSYANQGHTFYRHFIESPGDTYNFSINTIIGSPILMIGISSLPQPLYPTMGNFSSFQFINQTVSNGKLSIILSLNDRMQSDPYCATNFAGYFLNGGNYDCTFYIGVYCPSTCVYNITTQIIGQENTQNMFKYLIENQYYTGTIQPNQSSFFYYPISSNTGDLSIILNKTYTPGLINGDSSLYLVIINDTSKGYQQWPQPTPYYYTTFSQTNNSGQPEIIEICTSSFQRFCSQNQSCAVLLGVQSKNTLLPSRFRIKVLTSRMKLYNNQPIINTISQAGTYQYYFYSFNTSVANSIWEYLVSASILSQGGDVDLFISALDGRNPTQFDYDFASQHVGPEKILISQNSTFFQSNLYNLSNGVIFIVGVQAITNNVTYSLLLSGTQHFSFQFTDISIGALNYTFPVQNKRANQSTTIAQTYRWYNWGGGDFQFQINNNYGQVYAFINYFSDYSGMSNIYQSLPMNENNSLWSANVSNSTSVILKIYKEGIPQGMFCYYCWYYVTIYSNVSIESQYQLSIQRLADAGTSVQIIPLNIQQTLSQPSTGYINQVKFIFSNKAPFTITFTVNQGSAFVSIGLYPDAVVTKGAWSGSGSYTQGTFTINVKQTDPNFYIGAYYYMQIQSQNGKLSAMYTIIQNKEVQQLIPDVTYKDMFWTNYEIVKYYMVQVPKNYTYYQMTITFQALTQDFYPVVYTNKGEYQSTPSDIKLLNYSNFINYTMKFGDNATYILNKDQFSYKFIDNSSSQNTYQLLTLYSTSYGLNDYLKHQFDISISFTNLTAAQALSLGGVGKILSSQAQTDQQISHGKKHTITDETQNQFERQQIDEESLTILKWLKEKGAKIGQIFNE